MKKTNRFRLVALLLLPSLVLATASMFHTTTYAQEDLPSNSTQTTDMPQDSGYTDENGQPISIQEYDQNQQQATKAVWQRYPIPVLLVSIAIVSSSLYFITKKQRQTKKLK